MMSETEAAARRDGEPATEETCLRDEARWRQWLVDGIVDRRLQEAIHLWLDSEGCEVTPLASTDRPLHSGLGLLVGTSSGDPLASDVWRAMRRAHPGLTLTRLEEEEGEP